MVRKLAAVLLLSLLITIFVTSVCFGADRATQTTAPVRSAVYGFPDMSGDQQAVPPSGAQKMILRADGSRANPENLGRTAYDYQHNGTMGRLVEHRAGFTGTPYSTYIHFDWMEALTAVLAGSRGIGYQAYNVTNCGMRFALGGIRIDGGRAGYVNMDAYNLNAANSWGLPNAHQIEGETYAKAFFDLYALGPVQGVFSSDAPDDRFGYIFRPPVGNANENIWPKGDWDIDGADDVWHMVCSESSPPGTAAGSPQTCSYYRRVGPYGVDEGVWSNQHVIDTVMDIAVTVASSPISDKVAIVWVAPSDAIRGQSFAIEYASQLQNDVWFAIATDNGKKWADSATILGRRSIGATVDLGIGNGYIPTVGGNLTSYSDSGYNAYTDLSALWSVKDAPNDYLQIVWNGFPLVPPNLFLPAYAAIFHWNQKFDEIRPVAKAEWTDTAGIGCARHGWNARLAKMTISECDGKLYVCYTQFGSRAYPCGQYDNVNNVMSGRLYMSVYDEMYQAWDRPQAVPTGVVQPVGPCVPGTWAGPGDCNSEHWASMARYGRMDTCKLATSAPGVPVVDIVYINDYFPGGVVQPNEGVWTLNPVKWQVYECRDAVPEPLYTDNSGPGYGLCNDPFSTLIIGTTDDTTFTMTMENTGTLDNSPVSITPAYVSGGSGNTAVTVTPNAGISIPKGGGTFDVDITVTTTGEDELAMVRFNITVNHQAVEGNPKVIPLCVFVTDNYPPIENATINTTCKHLRVYNTAEMSRNASNASLDFDDDAEDCADVYLYSGSPIFCRDLGGTKKCYFSAFNKGYGSDDALRQYSPMFVDATTDPDYEYATAEAVTADSAIGLIVEYFAPKAVADCGYVIQKLKFWNRKEVVLNGVAAGEAIDWDVPVMAGSSANKSNKDEAKNLIYQTSATCRKDPCDTMLVSQRNAGIAAAKNVGGPQDAVTNGFKNFMTLKNAVYVYTSSTQYGAECPLPDGPIYDLMTTRNGFFYSAPTDTCEDLMSLVTFGVYDLQPNDTQCVVKILTTSKSDLSAAGLKANVDKANAFIAAHPEIKCVATVLCDCRPGDPNNDGATNLADAVYVINYVFKGGPAPAPYPVCSGDPNADCAVNLADAVYVINYVFKGGPAPKTCEQWRDGHPATPAGCGPLH